MVETIRGREVTKAQIEAWVRDAEAGFDVEELKTRGWGRPGWGVIASGSTRYFLGQDNSDAQ